MAEKKSNKVVEPEKLQPSKEETKKEKPKPKKVAKKSVHIDEFIETVRPLYDLNVGKANGFRAYMQGNHYLASLDEFMPYLERYLGKDVK